MMKSQQRQEVMHHFQPRNMDQTSSAETHRLVSSKRGVFR
jgi:hypothetical protein